MTAQSLHLIGHAHIDPVWLWPWQEGFHEVLATFRSALDRMREYPDFTFVASSAAFYEWAEQADPALFAEIQQRVVEGRWQVVGGWWVEPDCNIPGGEALVRHGLYGQRYFQQKFGKLARVGFNVDSFGHAGTLPQILRKSGIPFYNFLRPMPHEKTLPGRIFWWEADDGSRVLAYQIPFEYLSWGQEISAHVERCAGEIKAPVDEGMCFYGVGNHGGGPTVANLESIHALQQQRTDLPALLLSSPEAFFDSASKKAVAWSLPVVHSDLQHHAVGCYAAHSGIKQWNRRAEHLLVTAETWSTLATAVNQRPYPDLERAWKSLLFNQFHDILAGTSLPAAYDDARNDIGETMAVAGRALNLALQSFVWSLQVTPEEGARPLVVFNPHAWPVRAIVEIESERLKPDSILVEDANQPIAWQAVTSTTITHRARLCFAADLPPLGYRVYRMKPGAAPGPFPTVQASDGVLENSRFRLEIDPVTGCIASLYDKREGVDVFVGPAARPVVIDDPSDTWSHNTFRFDRAIGEFAARSVKLVEHGPVKSAIRVVSAYGTSTLIQDFAMCPDCDAIEVRVVVDWHERHKVLKLRFPIGVKFMRISREEAYGHSDAPANGDEFPVQRWIDVSGIARDKEIPYGFSLINDAKYSADVNVRDIGLTVLRSPAYAHHIPAVVKPDEYHPYQDQGIHEFHYTMLAHSGSWETAGTVRRAVELNQLPVAQFVTFRADGRLPQSDQFIDVKPEAVMVTVLKQAEEGDDLIVRTVETSGAAVHGVIRLPLWDRVIEADFAPGDIRTFRVPRDAALPVRETSLIEMDDV